MIGSSEQDVPLAGLWHRTDAHRRRQAQQQRWARVRLVLVAGTLLTIAVLAFGCCGRQPLTLDGTAPPLPWCDQVAVPTL